MNSLAFLSLLLPAALSSRLELRWRLFFWLLIAMYFVGVLLVVQDWQAAAATLDGPVEATRCPTVFPSAIQYWDTR